MGTTIRSRGTSIPRTANSYGDEPNDSGDDSAPAFRRIRERRGVRRHEEERLPGRVVDVAGAVRRRVREPRRGGGRRECAKRAHGHPVRGGRQDRLRAGLVPPRRIGPAHARGMAEHPRSDPGPMDREETTRPEGRGSLIPTGGFQLGEPYLPSSDGADRARMNDDVEREELCAGAILLGLSYTGQPERRMALERLEEFEVPTLVLVGFESDRTDLPLLRGLVASMTSVNLEIIAGADHRLQDAAGRTMTEAVLMNVDAWLHLRKAERGA